MWLAHGKRKEKEPYACWDFSDTAFFLGIGLLLVAIVAVPLLLAFMSNLTIAIEPTGHLVYKALQGVAK